MGKNTGKGSRIGAVQSRAQVYNSKTDRYVKINTDTGKIMSSKKTPYKGIKKKTKKK